jgi:hypothetical protein
MVEVQTANEVSRLSIQLSAVFSVVGVALLYAAIIISDASETMKIIWASGLSLTVAFVFLLIWTLARDAMRAMEREQKRKISP